MNYETTLSIVRELSENATLRPSPIKLRCVPLRTFVLKPVPQWLQIKNRLEELAAAMANSPYAVRS